MLIAPEQAFFLRENLKLRLLNARLALLSRQFDTAQSDLRDAQSALDRYFDRSSRRVVSCHRPGAPGERAGAAGRRAAARRHAGRHRRRGGRALTGAGPRHARHHLARAAVRRGRGGRDHAGRNDGLVSIYWRRLAHRPVAEPVRAAGAGRLRRADGRGAGDQQPDQPAAARRANGAQLRRERAAQAALREALAEYFGGALQPRAQGGAARAGRSQDDDRGAGAATPNSACSATCWPPAACTACRTARAATTLMRQLRLQVARRARPRPVDEGARLLAAEWALDDRDAPRALELLAELPPGVARRTQALRLRLLAHAPGAAAAARRCRRRACWPSTRPSRPTAAQSLLRSLAGEALDGAHDADAAAPRLAAARRRPTGATPAWPRARPRAPPHSAPPTTRAPGCARSGTGIGELDARRARARGAGAAGGRAAASASDWLPRLESAAQALAQRRGRGRRRGHGDGRAPAVGQGAPPAGAGRRRRRPVRRARGAAPGARWRSWRSEEGDDARAQQCERAAAAID